MASRTWSRSFRSLQSFRSISGGVKLGPLTAGHKRCESKSARLMQKVNYSHHPPFPYPEIKTQDAAKGFVLHLDHTGRSHLFHELQKYEQLQRNDGEKPLPVEVTTAQLRHVFLFNCVPFIGFGILDNMIMIVAGEYIDVTIGAALGISTMAAAALGNLVSDVAGVGSAGYVELLAGKLGMVHTPDISPAQSTHRKTRWSVGLGRAIGISLGCLIGMFPLLFFNTKSEQDTFQESDTATATKSIPKALETAAQTKNSIGTSQTNVSTAS